MWCHTLYSFINPIISMAQAKYFRTRRPREDAVSIFLIICFCSIKKPWRFTGLLRPWDYIHTSLIKKYTLPRPIIFSSRAFLPLAMPTAMIRRIIRQPLLQWDKNWKMKCCKIFIKLSFKYTKENFSINNHANKIRCGVILFMPNKINPFYLLLAMNCFP